MKKLWTCAVVGSIVALAVACSSSSGGTTGGGGGGGGGGSSDGGSSSSSDSSSSSTSNDHQGEQTNGACPGSPILLKGTASNGASCSSATDCSPTCCSCSNGDGNQWLAAECLNGKCSSSGACSDTESSDYCP